jgi:alpha-1,2-mannosyltransferase
VKMPTAAGEVAGTSKVPDGPGAAMPWLLRPGVVIALTTALALALRLFQLSRPGHLSGFTQYDDGVYFGNAVRLVHGVIPYRDFAMVQPPGSMLLMAPVALAAKVFGTVWGLGAARLLTLGADTANAALVGLLVRHCGSLAAGLASGGYAVYPAALDASQTLFLEPWLNLLCLLGALLVFESGQLAGSRRLAWGGACFGFAAAVKIWAFFPALLADGLCVRRRQGGAWFAGGFAVGLGVPCLPFLALAPGGFGRTVFVSELVQATHGRFGPKPRLADVTGLIGLAGLTGSASSLLGAAIAVSAVIGLLIAAAWILATRPLRAGRAGADRGKRAERIGPRLAALDWYVLLGAVAVTLMMFVPSEWYGHYAAFDGPFVALAVALPIARIAAVTRLRPAAVTAAGVTVLIIALMTVASVVAAVKQGPVRSLASAHRIIPPGACVVTDTASATIVIDRFDAASPGCPQLVDSVGTLIATTDGEDLTSRALLPADTGVCQAAFDRAQYVWLIGNGGNTGARIAWTWSLHGYFIRHFRPIAFLSSFQGQGDVPRGGLYIRKLRWLGN